MLIYTLSKTPVNEICDSFWSNQVSSEESLTPRRLEKEDDKQRQEGSEKGIERNGMGHVLYGLETLA